MPTSLLLAANILVFIVTGDTDQPIHIESDQQSLDMQSSVVTFISNVVITRDIIKISTDKVVITHPGGEQGKEVIDGYDKSATLCRMQDNGRPAEDYASRMHCELARDFIVLTGNTHLQQVDNNIKSDKIAYLVKEQKMQTFSDKGKRVTTILVPSQLQDKNNRGQTPAQREDD